MAITIRDAKSPPRQRNIASLVGGFVIAGGCFVLFVLVAGQLTHWPPRPLLWLLGADELDTSKIGAGTFVVYQGHTATPAPRAPT